MSPHRAFLAGLFVSAVLLSQGRAQDPLPPHPAFVSPTRLQLGQQGETLVRFLHESNGEKYFPLNYSTQGHGIDGLVRTVRPDGRAEYRIVEVKARHGDDFKLAETKSSGKQLSTQWIDDNLNRAVEAHPDKDVRQVAKEALESHRKNPLRAELHGIDYKADRYVIRQVDPTTVRFVGEPRSEPLLDQLKKVEQKALIQEVRKTAGAYRQQYSQMRVDTNPQRVKQQQLVKQMSLLAGVEEKEMSRALAEGSKMQKAGEPPRWVKAGGKVLKFVGKAAGPAGLVIAVFVYSEEAAEIEQKEKEGKLTREQANSAHADQAARTATTVGGGLAGVGAGAALGSFICPGPGTVIGGIVGGVGGAVGAEQLYNSLFSDEQPETQEPHPSGPTVERASVWAEAESPGPWEAISHTQVKPGVVALRFGTGYLGLVDSRDLNAPLAAHADQPGEWEQWHVIQNDDGTISLRTPGRRYLTVENAGGRGSRVSARAHQVGPWEKFLVEFDEDDESRIYLKTPTGFYLNAQQAER